MELEKLYKRSIEIILENQHSSGGYIASPTFPTYHYCWFRDGAYIAYAMNIAGEIESSSCFHDWASAIILKRKKQLADAIEISDRGEEIPDENHLHTRYNLDGNEGETFWENFQLDGLGTWLWSLSEHCIRNPGNLKADWKEAAVLICEYLKRTWMFPCYDLWEEKRDNIHIYTLASIYGGLKNAAALFGLDNISVCNKIKERILQKGLARDVLCKYEGSNLVDASLLGVSVPGDVLSAEDPLFQNTLRKIETDLLKSGGVHRYLEDNYFGGGLWLLLRGWLGLCQLKTGNRKDALEALEWMASKADEDGNLPEQVADDLLFPEKKNEWEQKWGISASPLLWSHAVFIWLFSELSL